MININNYNSNKKIKQKINYNNNLKIIMNMF